MPCVRFVWHGKLLITKMLRELVLIVLFVCVIINKLECKICDTVEVRNKPKSLVKLQKCTVIRGDLKILLLERSNSSAQYENYSFPELREITGYLLLYRVMYLESVGKLFPNLRLIRGTSLLTNFALIAFDMPHLKEIGLKSLMRIARGGVKVDKCPKMCYVDTIDWAKIGALKLNFTSTNPHTCPPCDKSCNNHCWNPKTCQQFGDECHKECLGCTKDHSASHCHVCKNFNNNGTCVETCPKDKLINRFAWMCMTEFECRHSFKGGWLIFKNECLKTCPPKTKANKDGRCEDCGEACKKTCSPLLIDSLAHVQTLKDCSIVNGSLEIRNINENITAAELEENLGEVEVIKDFLKITRSNAIRSLKFFKNLHTIKGHTLENNQHAFVIFENQNLQELWDFNATFSLQILNGTISFHNNPQLCLSEIEALAKVAGLADKYSDTDVSQYTNGDKSACHPVVNITVKEVEVHPTNITLSWIEPKNSSYIGYVIYYTEHASGSITTFESKDVCDGKGWTSNYTSINSTQLTNLKPYTRYAFYLKIYRLNIIGAQSDVKYFITKPDDPEQPASFLVESLSHDSITLNWQPPINPNGVLSYYIINYFEETDIGDYVEMRDYCLFPHVSKHESGIETTTAITEHFTIAPTTKSDKNKTCSCEKKEEKENVSLFTEEISTLCNEKFVSIHGDEGCKPFKYLMVDKDNSTDDFAMGDIRNSMEDHRLLKREVFDEIKESASVTMRTITNLKPYKLYVFLLSACNEETNHTRHCSGIVQEFARTKRYDYADNVTNILAEVDNNDVSIKWTEPREPNGLIVSYEISHQLLSSEHHKPVKVCITRQQYISNNSIFKFEKLPPGKYALTVQATSIAGPGARSSRVYFSIVEPHNNAGWISAIVVLIVLFSGLGYLLYWYRRKQKRMRMNPSVNPDYAPSAYVPDEWEIDRSDITLTRDLGHGTFGTVYSGFITSKNIPCAVKTVHENLPLGQGMEFLNEALVMKSVNKCNHVVKLLGVVSKGHPPMVIMELMDRGDLKSFLRASRDSSQNITSNELYRMSIEIADGMAYLAAKKFVHRDLAARNCMVAHDHTVKIGDFGMTRDIYSSDYYRKGTKGLLPVRWMAPESLGDGVFTSRSDVWSYGIVLWEMATLAEQPYQGLSNEQVLHFVVNRGKLQRPPQCADLLFDIMEACWEFRSVERPTFGDIVQRLENHVSAGFRHISYFHNREREFQPSETVEAVASTSTAPPPATTPAGDYDMRFTSADQECLLSRPL